MPKVSVILPCYNVGKYIERCLACLINQTLTDIEIICVNDKSTDNTWDIISQYANDDKRIVAIDLKQNSGAAIARNTGMDIASGEYIGFVDPDDYVDHNFFEELYACAIKNNSDVVKGNVRITDSNTGNVTMSAWHNVIKQNIVSFTAHFWSAIYKRTFIHKHNIRFPGEIHTSQDAVFLCIVALNSPVITFVDNVFYNYLYRRPGSLDSSILTHAKAQSKLSAFNMNLNIIAKYPLSKHACRDFVFYHVFRHLYYEFDKTFENPADRKEIFDLLHKIYKMFFSKRYMHMHNTKQYIKYIKRNNYDACIESMKLARTRLYLFGFIPFIRIDQIANKTRIILFDIFPCITTKNNKIYLFEYFLILKIRK
ncbi:MAG: glycosyltransferase [Alphaproteobacteria bacterium]|nr:glycosyltransferase [Alphaproteobacteria bacterium]